MELCRLWGYEAEEHIVQTKDGFLLGVHRLQWRRGEEERKVNNGPSSVKKRVVYLHHGLLMNSEVWVCLTDEQRCLPFELVERGFDVWVSGCSIKIPRSLELTSASWATTGEINTRKSQFTPPRHPSSFGIFRLTNLPFTISRTVYHTSWTPRSKRACHTSASPKAQPRHSQPLPSTLSSTVRSTFLSHWPPQWHPLASRMEL